MGEKIGDNLTAPQRRAIRALMESSTNGEAAKTARIAESTLYRWLNDPIFKSALQEAEAQAAGHTTRRLSTGTGLALDVLISILENKEAGDSIRLQAARVWLDNYHRARDDGDLDRRLTALEARMQAERGAAW